MRDNVAPGPSFLLHFFHSLFKFPVDHLVGILIQVKVSTPHLFCILRKRREGNLRQAAYNVRRTKQSVPRVIVWEEEEIKEVAPEELEMRMTARRSLGASD